jgi:NAD(P)-dependent dehydrogenase (short-subunit alcohol dehydrogenase family)
MPCYALLVLNPA